MKQSNNNLQNDGENPAEQRETLFAINTKIFFVFYCLWVTTSVLISLKNAEKIAAYFIDLPQGLKTLSPFILSIAYLDLFVPALLLVIVYTIYILTIVIRNGSWKNVSIYNYVQSNIKSEDPQ
jgi:hypothetical protein